MKSRRCIAKRLGCGLIMVVLLAGLLSEAQGSFSGVELHQSPLIAHIAHQAPGQRKTREDQSLVMKQSGRSRLGQDEGRRFESSKSNVVPFDIWPYSRLWSILLLEGEKGFVPNRLSPDHLPMKLAPPGASC